MTKYGDIEYLVCIYCKYLNELESNWRETNVSSNERHCRVCTNCHKGISISIHAKHPKSKFLVKNIVGN